MSGSDNDSVAMTAIGNVIEIVDLEDSGPAVILNTCGEELHGDTVIKIDSPLRIVAKNGKSLDTSVRGIELRPLVSLLLPMELHASQLHVGDSVFLV